MASPTIQTLDPDVEFSVIEDLVANVPESPDTFTRLAAKNKLAVSYTENNDHSDICRLTFDKMEIWSKLLRQ